MAKRNLLSIALQVFKQNCVYKRNETARPLRDDGGVFAYVFNKYVLVAKAYEWNGMVSVHRRAWDRCDTTDRKLIMYIQSPGGLYEFDITKVKGTFENLKDGARMINFPFKYGVKLGGDTGFLDNSFDAPEFIPVEGSNVKINTGIL